MTRLGAHITMTEFIPCTFKGIGEYLGIGVEFFRDWTIQRVISKCKICSKHDGQMFQRRVMSIGDIPHYYMLSTILWNPLDRSTWTLGFLPLILEQIVKVPIIPLRRLGSPSTLQPTCNSILPFSTLKSILPSQPHLMNIRTFRLSTHILIRISRTMRFAKGMSPCNQCHSLFIVHTHSIECFTNILGRCKYVRITIWSFRINID
mmetsp:Transcript_17084/g.28024  ORF Transcript_17084/g.28024 Transcript_17084/m.28024 type:complete len:205 (-) Transcript_17084:1340-1954(-)